MKFLTPLFLFLLSFSSSAQISNNVFTLESNLQIEIEPDSPESVGVYLFKKNQFDVILLQTSNSALNQTASLRFSVIRQSDNRLVHTFQEGIKIDTTGRDGDPLNQAAYDTYINELQTIKDSLQVLKAEFNDPTTLPARLEVLSLLIKEQRQLKNGLAEVVLIYEKIDKYPDIIGTMINNGILTAAGIEWAKTLPFLDGTLNDFITQ